MATMYAGEQPLSIIQREGWPETLAGGQFAELNTLYEGFLSRRDMMVQLCFKRMGIYSFGGFGASADTEGNAAFFNNNSGDMEFDKVSKIKEDSLNKYLMIPINPEEISVNYRINTNTYNTIFFAELASLSGIKLRRFSISSFFPYQISTAYKFGTEPIYSPSDYIKWITDCMENKVILAFKAFGPLAKPIPYMKCFIENFDTTLKANGDVEYKLDICEYIDYRKNLDMRRFVMEGDVLIVSQKAKKRVSSQIYVGDFVNVVTGIVYSDELKSSRLGLNELENIFFKTSPAASLAMLYTGKVPSMEDVFYIENPSQMLDNFQASLINAETVKTLAEMLQSCEKMDRNEIWMVVGIHSDPEIPKATFSLMGNITQIDNLIKDTVRVGNYGFYGVKNVELRSMKDGRHGWASYKQLAKVNVLLGSDNMNYSSGFGTNL